MTQVAPQKRPAEKTTVRAERSDRRTGTTDATTTEGREAPAAPASNEPAPEASEAVMGLDMLLVEGARSPLRRFLPPVRTTVHLARGLATKPDVLGRRALGLAGELGRIGVGRSEVEPNKKDKRFADPAWSGNPLLRRVMQAHLATAQTAEQLVEDAELDWQ